MEDKGNTLRVLAIAVILVAGAVIIRVIRDNQSDGKPFGADQAIFISGDNSPKTPDNAFFDGRSNAADKQSESDKSQPKPQSSDPWKSFTARAYLIGNVETGEIIAQKNSGSAMPVASMSKLITAIVATDTIASTTIIEITAAEASSTDPDSSGIGAGEKFALNEMLYPLLLSSSNIAAEAIASSTDRRKFLELMSGYAWEVGAPRAYFADPSGINPHNMASAEGIFEIAKYLYKSRSDILALTRIPEIFVATTSDHGAHIFKSTHPFVMDARFVGGKTGRTPEAGETMLTILNIDGQPIAFVVMGSAYGMREGDTKFLIGILNSNLARD